MKAAVYARVSTKDKGQDPKNQLIPIRRFCKDQGWEIVEEFVDYESAAGKVKRKSFTRMMSAADAREFDIVVFWALDRLSREGVVETLLILRRLNDSNVGWVSLQEPLLNTTTLGPMRDAIIALVAAVAQMESERRSERAKAAIARRKAEGRTVGAKRKDVDPDELRKMWEDGYSAPRIAKALGVSRSTVWNRLREYGLR